MGECSDACRPRIFSDQDQVCDRRLSTGKSGRKGRSLLREVDGICMQKADLEGGSHFWWMRGVSGLVRGRFFLLSARVTLFWIIYPQRNARNIHFIHSKFHKFWNTLSFWLLTTGFHSALAHSCSERENGCYGWLVCRVAVLLDQGSHLEMRSKGCSKSRVWPLAIELRLTQKPSDMPAWLKEFIQGERVEALGNRHQVMCKFWGVTSFAFSELFDAYRPWPRSVT